MASTTTASYGPLPFSIFCSSNECSVVVVLGCGAIVPSVWASGGEGLKKSDAPWTNLPKEKIC